MFATAGYNRASIREVARAAGITTPVVYDHFESKAQLYATVVDGHMSALVSQWSADTEELTPRQLFARTIEATLTWVEANENGWRLMFVDIPSDVDAYEALRVAQGHAGMALVGLFRRVPQLSLSAEVDRDRADQLLATVVRFSVHAVITWWWGNRDLPRDTVVRLATDMLWRGLAEITTPPGPRDAPNHA